jgi:hypothetical protein
MRVQALCTKTLTIVTLSMLILSCQKGNTGPAGPAGPTGSTGATGATGAAGPAGTANVIYSAWFTPSPWIKDTVFDIYGFNYTKAAADITQNMLDSGTVITYGKLLGYNSLVWPATQVAQLPIIVNYKFSPGGITYTDTWSALASAGSLKIRFVDDQNYYSGISNAHQFRYIIIPGGTKSTAAFRQGAISASGKQISVADLNEVTQHYQDMSYAEVCQRLGIEP